MKIVLLSLLTVFAVSNFAHAEEPVTIIMLKSMLLDTDSGVSKLATKTIFDRKIDDNSILDISAYQLSLSNSIRRDVDTSAWFAKTLMASSTNRYLPFLNEFLNQGIPDKLKRHVSATIKKLEKKSSADPFIVTSVNIEKLQKEVSEQFKLHVKTDRTFDTLSKGDGLDRVLQQLGLPNIIEQELVTIRQPYVGNILTQRLILKYSGLGSIRLGSNKGDLTAERIHKEIAISDTLKSSKHSEIISLVATGTPMEYRMTARRIYREKLYSQDILDVVAKRIWLDKTFKDKFAVDGMSWLIKSIGASANPRYRTLLKRLSKEAKSRKVKSWAKKAQKTLLKADAPQFEI